MSAVTTFRWQMPRQLLGEGLGQNASTARAILQNSGAKSPICGPLQPVCDLLFTVASGSDSDFHVRARCFVLGAQGNEERD
jgi:hypothetical protein